MEERFRGEDGYADWCLVLIDAGLCSCDGCGGHLVDGACLSCGCQHHVQEPSRHVRQRYPAWVPSHSGCRHADAARARTEAEDERHRRNREATGFADPNGKPAWLVRLRQLAREMGADV